MPKRNLAKLQIADSVSKGFKQIWDDHRASNPSSHRDVLLKNENGRIAVHCGSCGMRLGDNAATDPETRGLIHTRFEELVRK